MVGVFLEFKERFLERFAPQRGINEDDHDGADNDASHVEESSEPFPAGPPRVVKNRMRHGHLETNPILAGGMGRINRRCRYKTSSFGKRGIVPVCGNWSAGTYASLSSYRSPVSVCGYSFFCASSRFSPI